MSIGYENGVYTFFSKSVFGRWKEVRKFDISEFEGLKVCSYERNLFVLDYDTLVMYGWRNKSGLEKIFTHKVLCCKEIVSMQVLTGWIGTIAALFIINKEMISVMIIDDDNNNVVGVLWSTTYDIEFDESEVIDIRIESCRNGLIFRINDKWYKKKQNGYYAILPKRLPALPKPIFVDHHPGMAIKPGITYRISGRYPLVYNGEFHCIYLENGRHVNVSRLYNQFMKYLREVEYNDTDIIFTIAFPKHTERYISRVLSCVYVIHTLIKINGSLDRPSFVKSARKI